MRAKQGGKRIVHSQNSIEVDSLLLQSEFGKEQQNANDEDVFTAGVSCIMTETYFEFR